MKENYVYLKQDLENYLHAHNVSSAKDDAELQGKRAYDELCRAFRNHGDEKTVNELNTFIGEDEVYRRKLYKYCVLLSADGCAVSGFAAPASLNTGKSSEYIDFGYRNEKVKRKSAQTFGARYNKKDLEEFMALTKKEPSFGETVNKFMEAKQLDPPQIYRRGYIRRQDFSRLTGPKCTGMRIGKVFNIAIGLGLNLDETDELLHSAGFYIKGTPFEMVVCFFIKSGIYDVPLINSELDARGLETLTQYENVSVDDDFND